MKFMLLQYYGGVEGAAADERVDARRRRRPTSTSSWT